MNEYSEKVLIETLDQYSANIRSRGNKHIRSYAVQTVKDVMNLHEVVKSKEQYKGHENQRGKSRGIGV